MRAADPGRAARVHDRLAARPGPRRRGGATAGPSDPQALLYAALRLAELVAVDLEDITITAREDLLIVRSGKGETYREVPLSPPRRDALTARLSERAAADDKQLYSSARKGGGPLRARPISSSATRPTRPG